MRNFIPILAYIFGIAPLLSQPDNIEKKWQEECEKEFEHMKNWKTDQFNDFTYQQNDKVIHHAKVTLAKGFGALNFGNKYEAYEQEKIIKDFYKDYPEDMGNLEETNTCFAKQWKKLQNEIGKLINEKAKEAIDSTIAATPPPTVPVLKAACEKAEFSTEIKEDNTIVFNIKIRDCQTGQVSKSGYPIASIFPKESFDVIKNWLLERWSELDIGPPSDIPSTFELEVHGHSDAKKVEGDLEYPFYLNIRQGMVYDLVKYGNHLPFQKTDIPILNTIPWSDRSNEYLALARAWTPCQALRSITQKDPLLVAEEHSQEGGEHRGVDIKISSKELFKRLAKKEMEKLWQSDNPFGN